MEKVVVYINQTETNIFHKDDAEAMLSVLREGKIVSGRVKNSGGTFFTVHPTEESIKLLEKHLKTYDEA